MYTFSVQEQELKRMNYVKTESYISLVPGDHHNEEEQRERCQDNADRPVVRRRKMKPQQKPRVPSYVFGADQQGLYLRSGNKADHLTS